nr:unnamed protein product [Callosobruchus analis]
MLNFYVYILAMRFTKISLYSKLCAAIGLQQYSQNVVLKNAFDTFDVEKKGSIGTVMIGTILSMLGVQTTEQMLADIINEVDEDGNGYITTSTLKEILKELDDKLTSDELDMMIQEIDTDGSGTVDFDGRYLIRTGSGSSHRLNISHKMLGYFKPSLFNMYIYATPL